MTKTLQRAAATVTAAAASKPWYYRKTNLALIGLALIQIIRLNWQLQIPAWIDALLLGLAGYGANNHLFAGGSAPGQGAAGGTGPAAAADGAKPNNIL